MATTAPPRRLGRSLRPGPAFALAALLAFAGLGCTSSSTSKSSGGIFDVFSGNPYEEPTGLKSLWAQKPETDGMVLPGEGSERTMYDDKARRDVEEAKRLYADQKYAEAEKLFNSIAKAKKLTLDVQEDAVFYRGECQRLQANYRDAEGSLKLYIKSFPYGKYTAQANERLFDIANYWLNPTRERMKRAEEAREGKGGYNIFPTSFVHFSRDMPFNDVEGHALGILEEVRLNDIRGKLAERSLFYIATVKFFNAEYREADFYYSQIVDHYPQSDLSAKAMKQSIICKQIANGGTSYDTRLVEKCRQYLEEFHRAYPHKDTEWIQKQLVSINHQQADRDYNIAEFYRRTGHPGSAYFYYEIVRRAYPNTEYARKAEDHMNALRSRVEADQRTASADTGGRPWYQGIVDTLGPTRVVLDANESRPSAPRAAATGASPTTGASSAPPTVLPAAPGVVPAAASEKK